MLLLLLLLLHVRPFRTHIVATAPFPTSHLIPQSHSQVKSGGEAIEAEGTLASLLRLIREEGLIKVWAKFPVKGIQQFCTRFTYFYIYAYLLNRCAPASI
jgi:hypothetical protein